MACRVACSYVLCPWSVPPSVSCYQPAGFRYSASSRMPMLFGGSWSSILLLHLRLFDLPQVPRFSFCCFSIENITQRNEILPGIEFEKSLFSSDAARRGGSAPRVRLLDNCHPLGRVRVSSKQDTLYTGNGFHQPNLDTSVSRVVVPKGTPATEVLYVSPRLQTMVCGFSFARGCCSLHTGIWV